MLVETISKYIKLRNNYVDLYGEKTGNAIGDIFSKVLSFTIKIKSIEYELDLYAELYLDNIFLTTDNFYKSKLKKEYNEIDKKLIKEVNKILENPKHKLSDEITLLFYVGLYHKIENYEMEILNHFNTINGTNYKELYKIGIDTQKKKKLFADRDRLRLISNSIKHNQFFPKKELLKYYPSLDINKKISLSNFNPKEDILLVKHSIQFFNFLVLMKSTITSNKALFGENKELEKPFLELTKDISLKKREFKHTYLNK